MQDPQGPGHDDVQDHEPHLQEPVGFYDVQDPEILWVNYRPFRFHQKIGKGGFGDVCQVEKQGNRVFVI